jgi:hypothetical protein
VSTSTSQLRWSAALACVVLLAACEGQKSRSSGPAVVRLDGSTIEISALTQQIEALTRAAKVHGLTFTPLEWENYVPYDAPRR